MRKLKPNAGAKEFRMEVLWKRAEEVYHKLRKSHKKYIAMFYHQNYTGALLNVKPQDENEDDILTLCSLIIMLHGNRALEEPVHFEAGEGFVCSLYPHKDHQYLFVTQEQIPQVPAESR